MHYTIIIVGRESQIDLHFEPNLVFSDYFTNSYFIPDEDFSNVGMNNFPHVEWTIEQMLLKFDCSTYIGKNIGVIIIRVSESNSAKYGKELISLENCILAEFAALGFNPLIIDSEQLSNYQVHENSLMGTGYLSDGI